MRDHLIAALRHELSRPLREPAQVAYILLLTRKLLELDGSQKFDALKFHCDWAMHITLDRAFARKIVKRFDAIMTDIRSEADASVTREIALLTLFSLLRDFNIFLATLPLPPISFRKGHSFISQYRQIISGTPLKCEVPGQLVKQVTAFSTETGLKFQLLLDGGILYTLNISTGEGTYFEPPDPTEA